MSDAKQLLVDFYESFDQTIANLLVQEPLWDVCGSCTDAHCCKDTSVPITALEWELVTGFVRSNFSRHDKDRYLENVKNRSVSCPFLFGHRCSIYSVRPWVCRMHPYSITFQNENSSQGTFEGGTFVLPACPKLSPRFGTKVGIVSTVQPAVTENSPQERLVKLNLPEAGDFWVIDKSLYFTEFMELTPKLDDGTVAADFMENFFLQPLSMLSQGKIDERKFNQELGLE